MKKLDHRRPGNGDLRVEFKVQMPKYLSANQRAIMEMMANEIGDKSAKRVTNFGDASSSGGVPSEADLHKNEGFLKSAWHKITGQHDHLNQSDQAEKSAEAKPENTKRAVEPEEPKKASGSG